MTKNYAHRGFSGKYPENTMIAFEKAIEIGADGIETDVQLTKDGVPVICHDFSIDRCSNGTGSVSEYTFEYLRTLEFGGQKIPTLDETLALFAPSKLGVNIEIKNDFGRFPGIEEKVVALVQKYQMQKRVIISSFDHATVLRCRALDPSIDIGFLYECYYQEMGDYCARNGVKNAHPNWRKLDEKSIANLRKNGCRINAWTVNEEADIRRLIDLGFDIIIGNNPDLVKDCLATPV